MPEYSQHGEAHFHDIVHPAGDQLSDHREDPQDAREDMHAVEADQRPVGTEPAAGLRDAPLARLRQKIAHFEEQEARTQHRA